MNDDWQTLYSDNIKSNQLSNISTNLNQISDNMSKSDKDTKTFFYRVKKYSENQKNTILTPDFFFFNYF